MKIIITPIDPVFFGRGKPFIMGENSYTEGVFPPYPSVPYGAIRNLYFSTNPNTFDNANEDNDPTNSLKITHWSLIRDNICYYPAPLDLLLEEPEDKKKRQLVALSLEPNKGINSAPKTEYRLITDKKGDVPTGHFISEIEFIDYFNGSEINALSIDDFTIPEPKIGIARNERKVSKESMLYQVTMTRMKKNTAFAINIENLSVPDKGILKLGGFAKCAKYENTDFDEIKCGDISSGLFKCYLATPALFVNGWLPDWINEESFIGSLYGDGVKVQLMAACVGTPVSIGGFDMKARKPKPMRLAVPAGSVYYFKIIDEITETNIEQVRKLHGKAISDVESDRKQGFGITYIGGYRL